MASVRSNLMSAGPILLGVALCIGLTGCVERRMTVRTNPPGALLYVDDYEVGVTPVSTSFTYYGTRKIRLVKDGYETLTVTQSIPPPWYEYPVLDFVSENFVPGQVRDQRTLDFQLRPQVVVPTEQLISRAEQIRQNVHATSTVAAPGATTRTIPSSGPEVVPAPQAVGGQPTYPLPPR
ncbi:MAG: PEGA domain-containing protein [Thermoguttaceae bacterium]